MNYSILKKENGEVRLINIDYEELEKIKSLHVNPCATCDNAYTTKCEKIGDTSKKSIRDYDYITDGYQINKNGEVDNLIIFNCQNYVEDKPRKSNRCADEIKRLNELKASIKILYFDAGSIEEADEIQYNSVMNGTLTPVDAQLQRALARKHK